MKHVKPSVSLGDHILACEMHFLDHIVSCKFKSFEHLTLIATEELHHDSRQFSSQEGRLFFLLYLNIYQCLHVTFASSYSHTLTHIYR